MKNNQRKKSLRFHPFSALFGYTVYSVKKEHLEDTLTLCSRLGVSFYEVQMNEEGAIFSAPFFSSAHLEKEAKKLDIPLKAESSHGLPAMIIRHRHRLGVPVGIILSLLMIYFSSGVIWDVRVEGAERVREEDVEAVLLECGLGVGSKKSSLNIAAIENAALILSDEISWISVNVVGTVANVEIRELDFAPEDDSPPASNIVASENGKILGFENISGNIDVHIGDTVSKGQLLIGGIYGDEENDFRFTSAKGKVLAEVERTLVHQIPRTYSKKVYTGQQKCEKFLVFFKKEIKIFSNCGNLYPSYDKIDTVEYFRAPSNHFMPIGIRTVSYMEYIYEDTSRTDEELTALAKYQIRCDIASRLADGELLGRLDEYEITKDGIVAKCTVHSIENIAKTQIIEIGGKSPKKKE